MDDSVHFLAAETYTLPHFALFNSRLLRDFFKGQKLGVFREGHPDPEGSHAYFSHAITEFAPPPREELEARTTRKVLYYARPESHAGRNLFEIGVMALNEAIAGVTEALRAGECDRAIEELDISAIDRDVGLSYSKHESLSQGAKRFVAIADAQFADTSN